MKFRPVVTHALAAVTVLACAGLNGGAQARRSGPARNFFTSEKRHRDCFTQQKLQHFQRRSDAAPGGSE